MKLKFIFVVLIFLSCESRTVNPPPDQLIPMQQMENMLYDLALLNAIENTGMTVEAKAIFKDNYLERKYGIVDSVWEANRIYYAQDPKQMTLFYSNIEKRLKRASDSLSNLTKVQKKEETTQN